MSWEEVLKNDNEEIVPHKGIPTNRDEFYRSTFLNQAKYHEKELKRVKEFNYKIRVYHYDRTGRQLQTYGGGQKRKIWGPYVRFHRAMMDRAMVNHKHGGRRKSEKSYYSISDMPDGEQKFNSREFDSLPDYDEDDFNPNQHFGTWGG